MRFLRILTPLLCLAPTGWAQLTMNQKIADFMQLSALYAKNYAPYELRRDVFGFDLYNIQPWLDQISKTTDDISFYDICVKYVASLQDSHDEFTLPSNFEAWLHMDVDIYDGKVLIGFIDRAFLPKTKYPFVVGDEIVSVDGTSAADLITAFLPYAVNGEGSKTSRMRLAAGTIADRFQGWMPTANSVGDSATVVIGRQGGGQETYTIPWDKMGTPITHAGLIPSPHAMPGAAAGDGRGRARHPGDRHRKNPWGIWQGPPAAFEPDVIPGYMQAMNRLQYMAALAPDASPASVGIFPFGSPAPIFGPPSGFKLRLGSKSTDLFLSGTFPAGSATIGFIRIPTFSPPSTTTAVNQFMTEVQFFEQNTDALVVDVMDNGGGSICYAQTLAAALSPTVFRGAAEEIRATLEWQQSFSGSLAAAKAQGAPQYVIDLYSLYLKNIQEALAQNRGRTGSVPLCSYTFDARPPVDSKGNNLAYTKPILVLTDTFTLSSAEIFTMFLQDNKRATVFGTRTDGGGGNVVGYTDAADYSEGNARVTEGLITRLQPVQTPGFPLTPYYDGIGIYPDIVQDYQTLDNLLNDGDTFVKAFTAAVQKLAQPQ